MLLGLSVPLVSNIKNQQQKFTHTYIYIFTIDEITPFLDMFTYWSDKAKNAVQSLQLHVSIYVTRMKEGPDYTKDLNGFQTIYGERPVINSEMDRIKATNSHQTVWAHACGSMAFTRTVINEAIRHEFHVHNETFEF